MKLIKGTKIFSESELKEASQLLVTGKLVAFPTETVYGLGANALNSRAVKKIFTAKSRPADNPLILHIASEKDIEQLISNKLSKTAKKVISKFWPGPLTIVVPKSKQVPQVTTGGLDTVAIRMPNHPIALKLIEQAGVPLAAPSANLSGRPSPTLAQHVIQDLAGRIEGIINGGQTGIGVESTVIDLSSHIPKLLRPGGITYEQLTSLLGKVDIDPAVEAKLADDSQKAIAPGMKYKHYAPDAEVVLVEGEKEKIPIKIQKIVKGNSVDKLGIMATNEFSDSYQGAIVKEMGSRNNLIEISNNIFRLLREFDDLGVDKIIVEGLPLTGLGLAIMNRLRKSAGYKIIKA